MPNQDAAQIKEKIIFAIKRYGPSLPVHIAKEIGLSILFTSAFLSELLSEQKIKMTHMRVGSSAVFFIQGQESSLERFAQYLKSKEKEAFTLLKENKFLNDEEQVPAIRVALREIKDFAFPFIKEGQVYWRYFTTLENEFKEKEQPTIPEQKEKPKELEITEEDKKIKIVKNKEHKKISKKKPIKKTNDKFFNKIKEFLSTNSIEILDIEEFNKNDLALIIKNKGEEQLLIAYNKKRIEENDLIKAYKKATEKGLPYFVLSLGDPVKKLNDLIEAIKNLSDIKKVE